MPAELSVRPTSRPPARPPGPPVRIETPNYVLRSFTPEDSLQPMIQWAADAEVMQTLNTPARTLTPAQMRDYIARHDNRNRFLIGIFRRDSGAPVGFYQINCDHRHRLAETNVVIGERDSWGKKVVLETRPALFDFLFETVKTEKIWGAPFVRNFAAVYNYQALGFTHEGTLRKHRRAESGARIDQYMFGLLREEWVARKARGARA